MGGTGKMERGGTEKSGHVWKAEGRRGLRGGPAGPQDGAGAGNGEGANSAGGGHKEVHSQGGW